MKHHEFWPARPFETPGYIYLAFQCLGRLIGARTLMKANFGIDHGGHAFASKYHIQQKLASDFHPKAIQLLAGDGPEKNKLKLLNFAEKVGFPVILKPDYGFVGKGIIKINKSDDVEEKIKLLEMDFIVQEYIEAPLEFGVFYLRSKGKGWVSGINKKHFPTVIGNGKSTIEALVKNHYRYTHYWHSYLEYVDTSEVLPLGEKRQISFIGSHTMGCKFTEDTHLKTPALEKKLNEIFKPTPGFNYGRLDVRTSTLEDFQKGKFVIIEINGVDSLPTNMFDPKYSLWQCYRILLDHFYWLAKIAAENKSESMEIYGWRKLIRETIRIIKEVNHQQLVLENE